MPRIRHDGYIFRGYYYSRSGVKKERWISPNSYFKILKRNREFWRKTASEKPELIRRRKIAYRAKQAAIQKRRRDQNPELCTIERLKRIGLIKRRALSAAQERLVKQIYLTRKRISKCTGIAFHVDHIKPLSRGGYHEPNNLQIITARANLSKGQELNEPCPYAETRNLET